MELNACFLDFLNAIGRLRDAYNVSNIILFAFFEIHMKIRCFWSFHDQETQMSLLNERGLSNSVHGGCEGNEI
jgi:hypothetical protein